MAAVSSELIQQADQLLSEASRLDALAEELSNAAAQLTQVWLGPAQERLQSESAGQVSVIRGSIESLRDEAAVLIDQAEAASVAEAAAGQA